MTLKKTNLLIASSSPDEAITHCVLNNKKHFNLNIDIVFINELMTDYQINDELSDNLAIVRWFKDTHHSISNQTHFLLNRTLYIHDDLFLNFIEKDREYAQREFEAYLGFSLNAFEGVGTQTVNGLCDRLYSLPEQWQKIQTHTGLDTPDYYWGPKNLCNLNQNIIYSDIYHLFNWSTAASEPKGTHIFCFKKPPGHPLFVLSVGEKILILSDINLPSHTQTKLLNILKSIRTCFGYFVFETLLFVHKNNIQFGCVNLELTRASKHRDFEQFICNHLMREYFKCLN
jgi:hypothetical protein